MRWLYQILFMAARGKARPYFLSFPVALFALCAPPWFLPVGPDTWKIRLACIMVLFPMITAGITYYLLTLKVSRQARGKVPQNSSLLKIICQIAVSATALLVAGGVMVPFEWSGLKALATAQVDSFVGCIADNECKMGTWSFSQI
jgi:hypothetical protein